MTGTFIMPTTKHKAPWEAYGISRATYFRRQKTGEPFVKAAQHKKYIGDWVAWRESGLSVRPGSASVREIRLYYLEKYFERFDAISAESLEQWLLEIPAQSYSKRKHIHSAVSAMAKYLQHREVIDGAEYLKIKALYPKRSPYHPPQQRIIYPEDLQKLIEQAEKNHHRYQRTLNITLLKFLSETALRVTEACHLKRVDLRFSDDPRQAVVTVRSGKGGKRRLVPFSKQAQEAVREYLQVAPEGDYVFYSFNPSHGYQPMNRSQVARRFQAIAQKTGISMCPHSLRHYRITRWANNPKIPITATQLWAGHSSMTMTEKYIHLRDEEALAAAFEAT